MGKTGVIALVVGGVVLLVGGVAWAASPSVPEFKPLVPGAPPPPPPTLNQTIYEAGRTATQIGVQGYTALTGSRPTTKDVALTVATGGIYPQAKAALHVLGKLF
jgi:hypothetical protein